MYLPPNFQYKKWTSARVRVIGDIHRDDSVSNNNTIHICN